MATWVIDGAGDGGAPRRRFSDDDKARIVSEAMMPGASVLDVARRHRVCTSLVYRWRRTLLTERVTPKADRPIPGRRKQRQRCRRTDQEDRMRAPRASVEGRSYHHGSLRQALLDCAARLARETGGLQLTVKMLTDETGVTPPAFYRHFASVDDLLEHLRQQGLELLEEAQKQAARAAAERPGGDRVDDLSGRLRASIKFALDNPGQFRIMNDSEVSRAPGSEEKDRPAIARIVDVIREGQEAGEIVEGNPRDYAIATWAASNGLASLFATGPLRKLFDDRPARAKKIEDTLIAIIERGLRRRS